MEQQLLFNKYSRGKHWKENKTNYSEYFSKFLKNHNSEGLIVDVGCGEGKDVKIFSREGFKVLGIDKDKDEIELARSNYPNCNFEVQDVEELEFKDNSISAFFMINIIHYVKMGKAIEGVHRALKKGGYLFIHFNISIIDNEGKIDYEHKEEEIFNLLSDFKIIEKKIIERVDKEPMEHTHRIMELILEKSL